MFKNNRMLVNVSVISLFLIQIIVNLIAYKVNQQLLDAVTWVSHTHEVLYSLNDLWVKNIEIADEVDDYLQSHNPTNFKNYQALNVILNKKLADLLLLVKDNPQQINNLNLISALFLKESQYYEEIIKKSTTTNEQVNSKKYRLEIYGALTTMLNRERTLLEKREQKLFDGNKLSGIFLKTTNILNVVLIILFLIVFNRQYSQAEIINRRRRQAESHLNGIIQGTNDSIAAINTHYKLINFNKSFEEEYLRLYGKPLIVGANIKEYIQQLPDEEKVLLTYWDKALRGQELQVIHEVQSQAGQHCFEITFSPVRDKAGHLIGAAQISRNITERLQLEKEMEQTNKNLERSVSQIKDQNLAISSLNILGSTLQSCLTVGETLTPIATYAPKIILHSAGILYLAHPSRNYMDFAISWGQPVADEKIISPDHCWALRRGQSHIFYDIKNSIPCEHIKKINDLPPSICMPLQAQNDSVGLLYVEFSLEKNSSEEAFHLLARESELIRESFAETISLSLANIKLRDTLRHRSIRDPLTGLYNRSFLDESFSREVHRAQRQNHDIAVIMMDIDHFKTINDSFGHEAGDAVLIQIANILTKNVRQSDIICRYGGEEILLLLFDINSLEEITLKIEEVRVEISKTNFIFQGKSLGAITASFGIAFLSQVPEPEHLITEADRALYLSKKSGRNKITLAQ